MKNLKLKLKNKEQNFKREFSAGGVVFKKSKVRGSKFQVLFLLGKHSGYHKWVLPKGLIEEGESLWTTAIRETEEEMGVKTKLVQEKPVHIEEYVYFADFKDQQNKLKVQSANLKTICLRQICQRQTIQSAKLDENTRRVGRYQESFDSAQDKFKKTKVLKTVTFYLLEYVSGDPKDHGWEMEEVGWFSYEKALEMMSFEGEKKALEKARRLI